MIQSPGFSLCWSLALKKSKISYFNFLPGSSNKEYIFSNKASHPNNENTAGIQL